MKKMLFVLAVLLTASLAVGQTKLTLAQGKVEIDKALKAYAADWSKANNAAVNIKTVGGGNDLGTELKAAYTAGDMPDIFVIAGPDDMAEWSGILADLSAEKWVAQTSVAYKNDAGKVIGFPVAVEGWGMAYNADAQKDKLGLKSVVSMVASIEMFWVTAHHNVNSYLSNGLKFGDKSVALQALADYADWVELLFKYSDKAVLTTGNDDSQVGAFASGKTAFLHQGNWVDPNLKDAKITFKAAFAPMGPPAP